MSDFIDSQPTMKTSKRLTITKCKAGISSFSDIEDHENSISIDISGNWIKNFDGMKVMQGLTSLNLDNNPISSFKGAQIQPKLKWLSMKKTHISRNPYFKIMCLVVFGEQLSIINNERVTDYHRKMSKQLNSDLLGELVVGHIISNMNPLRLIDAEEKVHIVNNLSFQLLKTVSKVTYPNKEMQSLIEDYHKALSLLYPVLQLFVMK